MYCSNISKQSFEIKHHFLVDKGGGLYVQSQSGRQLLFYVKTF